MNRFKLALDVQDACNISGVARSLVTVIDDARANPIGDTNPDMDPAVILFVYKLASLCGDDYAGSRYVDSAWSECETRKNGAA